LRASKSEDKIKNMNTSEIKDKKIILFPGGLQLIGNYSGYEGVDIWANEKFRDELKNSDYFIGHSAGASFAIQYAINQTSKFILVNPVIKKRNALNIFIRWLKFLAAEGIERKHFLPAKCWISGTKKVFSVLKFDLLDSIKQIPNENVIVIRGIRDHFFCDEEAAEIIKENNIRLIEVDAGHYWNENIANAVREIIYNE
jgi:hypothetical protein